MSDFELAWAAGFWDGEGCVYLQKRPVPTQSALVGNVAQVERETMDRFVAAVGGRGSLFLKTNHNRAGAQPCWVWQAGSNAIVEIMELLWPYLSRPKKDQFLAKIEEKRALGAKGNTGAWRRFALR